MVCDREVNHKSEASCLIHAVLLQSELPSVTVRRFGHVLQLLLLQLTVFRRHSLTQLMNAEKHREGVIFCKLSLPCSRRKLGQLYKPSLYVKS